MEIITIESPGKTYSTDWMVVEFLGKGESLIGKPGKEVTAVLIQSEEQRTYAFIKRRDGKLLSFETGFDRPGVLSAFHDAIQTGGGRKMTETDKQYLDRISVSYRIKLWQSWNERFRKADGFWGVWYSVAKVDLQEGCYWVIPSSAPIEPVGKINNHFVANGSAEPYDQFRDECYEPVVFWFLVRAGEAYPIGRWGLEPDFLAEMKERESHCDGH
jgi:hypothetical protein